MTEFEGWPKIPRLLRNCIATEKLDGTNAAVLIEEVGPGSPKHEFEIGRIDPETDTPVELAVFAQSRKRFITPGNDNYGFAGWVAEHLAELTRLGPGRHFGEWWGKGIQRNYGLDEKRFSLFNSGRWEDAHRADNPDAKSAAPPCCHVVPIVATGKILNAVAEGAMASLEEDGSRAAPGFMEPEGIVVYHAAARSSFKVTFDQDDLPKSLAEAGVVKAGVPQVESEDLQPDVVLDSKTGDVVATPPVVGEDA